VSRICCAFEFHPATRMGSLYLVGGEQAENFAIRSCNTSEEFKTRCCAISIGSKSITSYSSVLWPIFVEAITQEQES
jgi:hypothetical protein